METPTVKGCVCAHVDGEVWALLHPTRETRAEFLSTARRILVNLEGGVAGPVGYVFFLRRGCGLACDFVRVSFGRRTGFVVEGCRIWIVGSRQLDMASAALGIRYI